MGSKMLEYAHIVKSLAFAICFYISLHPLFAVVASSLRSLRPLRETDR
jgi:hypothetical protein